MSEEYRALKSVQVKLDQEGKNTGVAAISNDNQIGEASWSSKNIADRFCLPFTKSGAVVTCQPIEGYPLEITTDENATKITCCGKNLFDYVEFCKSKGYVEQPDGSWMGEQTTGKVFTNNTNIDKQITISYVGKATARALCFAIKYEDGSTQYISDIGASEDFQYIKGTTTKGKVVSTISWWYNSNGTIYVKDVQIEFAETPTPYESYRGNTASVGEPILSVASTNYVFADVGEITVKGREDPAATYKRMNDAIINLGNVL